MSATQLAVLRKKRAPVRALVTRSGTETDALIANDPIDIVALQALRRKFERLSSEINQLDEEIKSLMATDATTSEDDYAAEIESMDVYLSNIETALCKISEYLADNCSDANSNRSFHSFHDGSIRRPSIEKKRLKLPKLEIRKFSGRHIDWLTWWAHFEKIDKEDIPASDKFDYLQQAQTEGTRAHAIVHGYPMTDANYPIVIKALKDRYAKPKLLRQLYVRELLNIVLKKEKNPAKIEIAQLYDKLDSHIRALETLDVTPDQTSAFLYPIVESSLPENLFIAWQRSPSYLEIEDGQKSELSLLMKFLSKEADNETERKITNTELDRSDKSSASSSKTTTKGIAPHTTAGLLNTDVSPKKRCVFCPDKPHYTSQCRNSRFLSMEKKLEMLKATKTCFKCLRPNHRREKCENNVVCEECNQTTHLRPMCQKFVPFEKTDSAKLSAKSNSQPAQKSEEDKSTPSALKADNVCRKDILLKTLMVNLKGPKGTLRARLFFDEGSQQSYVRVDDVRKVGPNPVKSDWSRSMLFGGVLTKPSRAPSHELEVSSLDDSFSTKLILRETPVICGAIPRLSIAPWMDDLAERGIELSDVNFVTDEKLPVISIQIGSDYRDRLIISAPLLLDNGLSLTQTKFGWTASGAVPETVQVNSCLDIPVSIACAHHVQMSQLWELEALGIRLSDEDDVNVLVQEHFDSTVKRTEEGRYCVALPWKEPPDSLPTNWEIAESRLKRVTKRLNSNSAYELYDTIFTQWIEENIIEKVPDKQARAHFLPHRPVFKDNSATTPVRPVFDASCKVGRANSINDCLHKGPNLLDLLPSFLLRFREKQIGYSADIRKAFLMIEVAEKDRDFLRFLWWSESGGAQIQEFQHLRLVFGLNCSPYLLSAVLTYHFTHWKHDPEVTSILAKSFYVDNLVGSIETEQSFLKFQNRANDILQDARMELREWHSNCIPGSNTVNILGISWNDDHDTLFLAKQTFDFSKGYTRRTLSAAMQKTFDPLGFISAVTMLPKIWLQKSWRLTRDWDESLPEEIVANVKRWVLEVPVVWSLKFNRYLRFDAAPFELHVFCDASSAGYASAIFARLHLATMEVMFVQARTRLAPITPLSIPRLELLGCWLGTRLLLSTLKSLTCAPRRIIFWTDSTTALAWIAHGSEWSIFVQNRVTEIRQQMPPTAEWRHVPGKLNPADLPSRGSYPSTFADSRWWEGPQWLKNEEDWPSKDTVMEEDKTKIYQELRKSAQKTVLHLNMTNQDCNAWYLPTSKFSKNVRIMAYILRVIRRCKQPSQLVSFKEYQEAENMILQKVQSESFSAETKFPVKTFTNDGLICVKTKLSHSALSTSFRFPILLPCEHPAVEQIIRMEHLEAFHCGPGILAARLRARFWILYPRRAIRRVLKQCLSCNRFVAKRSDAPEGELPPERTALTKVFATTGIDLAGPLYCCDGSKCWLVLFTCAVYRAIHLELVTSISTEEFLRSFRRFICRRGRPSTVFTDNGTNFEGTVHYFTALDWNQIQREYATQPIVWKFNPPSAPWWGGFWERLIKMVKQLLKRTLSYRKLTLSQIEDVLFEIEAVVNSRPLTYLSTDSDDLEPLTPAHFLGELTNNLLPELDALNGNQLRRKFQILSQLRGELKQRFRKEYLGLLVHRANKTASPTLQVGDVVLIESDENRQAWRLGRVSKLIPGRGSTTTRLVQIWCNRKELLRPIQRVYQLEIRSEEVPLVSTIMTPSTVSLDPQPIAVQEREARSRYGRVIKRPIRLIDSS